MSNEFNTCSGCEEALSIYENRYECEECRNKYILCEACRFSEAEKHPHTLTRIDACLRDYPYYAKESPKKSAKGAKLVLGSFSAALPNSETIKKENIKGVLTLVQFDTTKPPKDNSPYVNLNFPLQSVNFIYINIFIIYHTGKITKNILCQWKISKCSSI